MNIVTEIKAIVQAIVVAGSPTQQLDFFYNSWPKANEDFDNANFPAVELIRVEMGNFTFTKSGIGTQHDIILVFGDKTTANFDSEANEAILVPLRKIAVQFLKAYNDSGKFEFFPLPTEIPFLEFYEERFDAFLTGIELHLRCKPTDYDC
jgi:hypothetical protein